MSADGKPRPCEAHGVLVHSGECPDCVGEGVAVLNPAPRRSPLERTMARAALLHRLNLLRALRRLR